MSLPSYALYYNKQGEEIHREFVNIGWCVGDAQWLNCASRLPIIFNANTIQLYGVNFPASYLRNKKYKSEILKLYRDHDKEYKQRKYNEQLENIQILKAKQEIGDNEFKILMPMIKAQMPSIISSELIGVQPMTESTGQIFKIKYVNHSSRWYKFTVEFKKWIIFIKSIIVWYKK